MPPVAAGFSLPNRQYHIKFFIFISLCGDRSVSPVRVARHGIPGVEDDVIRAPALAPHFLMLPGPLAHGIVALFAVRAMGLIGRQFFLNNALAAFNRLVALGAFVHSCILPSLRGVIAVPCAVQCNPDAIARFTTRVH